jgi:very-short-patch-repair endonuclease
MSRILQDRQSTKEKRKILKNNQTKAEEKIWNILRNRQFMGLKFRRQHPI